MQPLKLLHGHVQDCTLQIYLYLRQKVSILVSKPIHFDRWISFITSKHALKGARARDWAASAPICFRCREGKLDVSSELVAVAFASRLLHVFWDVPSNPLYHMPLNLAISYFLFDI